MIRLVMIVKNEEDVIARSLRSVLPHVDSWCIVDTGSTDKTKEIIAQLAAEHNVAGELHDRPWVNFGHNRSEALEIARAQKPDSMSWLYMMDADDIFHAPPGKLRLSKKHANIVNKNCLSIRCCRGSLEYWRPQFFKITAPWVYKGALHEYVDMPAGSHIEPLRGLLDFMDVWLDARTEGARSKNPKKYEDDAILLDAEVERDPDDTRSLFYAAQSWRDCGQSDKALQRYLKRYEHTGGFSEERYVSLLNAIRLTPNLEDAKRYAWLSLNINPARREAVTAYLRRNRALPPSEWTQEQFSMALFCATVSSPVAQPSFLFAENNVYDWSFADELSILAYYLNHFEIALRHAEMALQKAPEDQKKRIVTNVNLSKLRLPSSIVEKKKR